jgi:hypothetical protein
MPKNEVANPMDMRGLVVVNSLVIVKAIQGLCNSRGSILLCQTQHGIDVGLLLRLRQLSPVPHVRQTIGQVGRYCTIRAFEADSCRLPTRWPTVARQHETTLPRGTQ